MNELLLSFGRDVVKVLISLLVGAGVGLVTFGISAMSNRDLWAMREPPGEMFLAFGLGLLSAGAMMTVMFPLPRLRKSAPHATKERFPVEEWSR